MSWAALRVEEGEKELAIYTPPERDIQVRTPETWEYRSYDAAMDAIRERTMTLNGNEVPIEIVPGCGVGYLSGNTWERFPVNGGDPVYGEYRDGDTVVGMLYFVYADGRALELPIPETAEGPCRMAWSEETSQPGTFSLAGQGDIVYWSCYLPEGQFFRDGETRGVRYTLYVPTGEVFIRETK